MKLLFCVLSLVSASAFATTCFTANIQTPPSVPARVCFDSIQIRHLNQTSQLFIHGPDVQGLYDTTQAPVSAHPVVIQHKAVINLSKSADYGCGSSEKIDLVVKVAETSGEALNLLTDLFIAVQQEQTNDTCHSEMQMSTFYYTVSQ